MATYAPWNMTPPPRVFCKLPNGRIYICVSAYGKLYMTETWVIIRVNKRTRDSLHDIKRRTRLSSLDAVIDYLLAESKLSAKAPAPQNQDHQPTTAPLTA